MQGEIFQTPFSHFGERNAGTVARERFGSPYRAEIDAMRQACTCIFLANSGFSSWNFLLEFHLNPFITKEQQTRIYQGYSMPSPALLSPFTNTVWIYD